MAIAKIGLNAVAREVFLRLPATSRRPEKEAAKIPIEPSGSAVLDCPAHDMVSLAGCLGDRQTRNRGGLASGRVPPVWRWKSRPRGGRPRITQELRGLIRRLAQENAGWGAPKIYGELQKLGFLLSERTVARYPRRPRVGGDAAKKWPAFLHNHREAIVASTSSPFRPRPSECCTSFWIAIRSSTPTLLLSWRRPD
jgi:hypothetical protein